jgi:hypothetical protein
MKTVATRQRARNRGRAIAHERGSGELTLHVALELDDEGFWLHRFLVVQGMESSGGQLEYRGEPEGASC